MSKEKILVTGANGQIGSVLTQALRGTFGVESVVATDIREPKKIKGTFELLNVLDAERMAELIKKHKVTQIYHLAAILSAAGEAQPKRTWDINMSGLLNVFEVARETRISRVFFPSSIAVFGEGISKVKTPQDAVLKPTTVYGISKVAGELWCQYYHQRYGLDIRSMRYPGVIGYQSEPGGGTTDYAVDIYHYAVKGKPYSCFLREDTALPMLYMDDTIRAAIELMAAPSNKIQVRTSYNLGGMSFTPAEIAASIKKSIPSFQINYQPDERQNIADSWPNSIDDSAARRDWGWQPKFDLDAMTEDMLKNLRVKYLEEVK